MTERSIPDSVRQELEEASTGTGLLGFLTISHASLSEPIRVVSDVIDYSYAGNLHKGLMFDWQLVTDGESAPEAQLTIQNVDRRIGRAIRAAEGAPALSLVVLSTEDFDLGQDPRVPIGTPSPVYSLAGFQLSDVQVDVLQASGRITLFDPSTEPYPAIKATQDRFPGLFR